MRKVQEVIVVEGRYDKNKLRQIFDCTVFETSGFSIFSDKQKISLLKKLAEKRGVIILTDSDSAGFLIRNHIKGSLGGISIKHAYIPDIYGREKRKTTGSKEGKLGVEGMSPEIIIQALERGGATFDDCCDAAEAKMPITKTDLYFLSLSGTENSAKNRSELLKKLDLPERLTANSLLDVLNTLYTRDEFFSLFE